MDIITRLACEIVDGLGCHRADVEAAFAESDGMGIATLRVVSDKYVEVVKWGLPTPERKALDAAIRQELRTIRRW